MMPLCSIFTKRLPSGEIKYYHGRVSPPHSLKKIISCLFNHLNTDNPDDAFWLAQIHFMMQQYSRAERLLTRPFPLHPPSDSPFFPPQNNKSYANGHDPMSLNGTTKVSRKGKGKEPMNQTHARTQPQLINDPMFMTSQFFDFHPDHLKSIMGDLYSVDTSRLVDMSIACRYLAAQCQVRTRDFCIPSATLEHFISGTAREMVRCIGNVGRI